MEARLAGFVTGRVTAVAVGGMTIGNQDISLSASTASSELRIVLTWGNQPAELDAHLVGPLSGSGTFHVFYSDKGSVTAAPYAQLDLDDTSGYGPETITIRRLNPGKYQYAVHGFTERNSGTSAVLASSSRAQVSVYRGDTRHARFCQWRIHQGGDRGAPG